MDRRHLPRRDVLRLGGLVVPALAAPALLTGCGTNPASSAGNVLRVSQPADPDTMDPQKQGGMASMNALINMFDTLTTRGRDNQLHPRLALSWAARDQRTWRFTLRPGVTFHNGEPCDAAAIKFSIERLLDPATKSPIVELRYVHGVSVVDKLTVDMHTTLHDPILPDKLSLFGGVAVPPRYLAQVGDDGFANHPVGTGPFTFVHWQRDHELRMRAYPQHWNGRPSVDELVFSPAPNPASSLAALQSGQVDLVAGLTPDAAQQLDGYPGVKLDGYTGIRTSYLSLNTLDKGPLADRRVRQALNHAVDVPLLIKAVLGGKATETPALIPRGAFGFDPSVKPFTRSVTDRPRTARGSRLPARLHHHAHRLQHRLQRGRSTLRTAVQGRRARPGQPHRPRHLLGTAHFRQPRRARPDVPGGQHRLDPGRREHGAVERAQRPPAEPVALQGSRSAHRHRGALRGYRETSAGFLGSPAADAAGGPVRLPVPGRQHHRPQRATALEARLGRRTRHGERGGLPMTDLSLRQPRTPASNEARTPRDGARLLRTVLLRLGTALLVLLLAATVAFFLVRLSGDPVKLLLPPDATAQQEATLRGSLGLDRPLLTQYADFIWGLPRLDFGDSLVYHQPVRDVLADRLPATLELAAGALVVTLVIAIPAGIFAAMRRGRASDRTVMTGVLLGQSTPPFWVGILLILVFAVTLHALPASGYGTFANLVLPSVTLAVYSVAVVARLLRSSLIDVLSSDHIRTARAKGFGPVKVVLTHGLRNASLPVVTVIGLEVGSLLGGAILTEQVFSWPGVGQLTIEAISKRDFPMVQATVLFFAATFVVVNLLVDLSYSFLDPRVRASR